MPKSRFAKPAVFVGVSSLALILTAIARQAEAPRAAGSEVPGFWVRPGFQVTLVAENLPNARFMEFDDKGNLYLSQPNEGKITTLRPSGDGYAVANTFVDNYGTVHGLCWADGWLYFTQSKSIHRAQDTDGDGKADKVEAIIPEGTLPGGTGHWWRSILVTKDALYTSVGDSGNISEENDSDRQKIWKYNLDGTGKTLWSSGIRNTEKLRLRPGTDEIWGIDHGSDDFAHSIGETKERQPITDLNPPEELNHYREGGFYGHPYITGHRVPRPEYQGRPDVLEIAQLTIPPAWNLGAHWAGNGFTFVSGKGMPADFAGDMIAAFHGSWNSTRPVGYRVERILFDKESGLPCGNQAIVETHGGGEKPLARPVDCVEAPDGSILFSDDYKGRIFRIRYTGGAQ